MAALPGVGHLHHEDGLVTFDVDREHLGALDRSQPIGGSCTRTASFAFTHSFVRWSESHAVHSAASRGSFSQSRRQPASRYGT